MKVVCKDLDNKNCSLKNEIKTIEEGAYLVCEECGGDLTVSNSFIKILFSFLLLLLIGGGIYFYMKHIHDDKSIKEKEDISVHEKSIKEKEDTSAPEKSIKEEEDTVAPEKPIVLTDISQDFYSDMISLELKGEADSRVYINNEDMGAIGKNGKILLPLDISKIEKFEIFLEDTSVNKNRSEVVKFSINKKESKKLITENGVNFAFVSNTKQEVSYLLEPYITYSDNKKSIYTKDYIELKKSIYIQTTPVTIGQFKKFVDENTSYILDGKAQKKLWNYKVKDEVAEYFNENYPVANVSLKDIEKYIEWLSKKTGHKYRLPTVEDWIMTINQNLVDTDVHGRRQKVDPAKQEVSEFIRNLFEFSSTQDSCTEGKVLLLSNSYSTTMKNIGKKRCQDKLSKFVTFRLVREK